MPFPYVLFLLGGDGNMYFTENTTCKLGTITPAGPFPEYTVVKRPNAIDPFDIANVNEKGS